MFIVALADRHHGAFTLALFILSLVLHFFAKMSLREIFSQQRFFTVNTQSTCMRLRIVRPIHACYTGAESEKFSQTIIGTSAVALSFPQ